LLVDPVALVYSSEKLDGPSSFEEAYVEYACWDAMEIGSKPIVESRIDSKLTANRSVVE
jgi:hypothetical protein